MSRTVQQCRNQGCPDLVLIPGEFGYRCKEFGVSPRYAPYCPLLSPHNPHGCCPEKSCHVGSWDAESCRSCGARCGLHCDLYRGAFATHVRIHPPTHPVQAGLEKASVKNCAKYVDGTTSKAGCRFLVTTYVAGCFGGRRCTHPYQGPTSSIPGNIICPFVKVLQDTEVDA